MSIFYQDGDDFKSEEELRDSKVKTILYLIGFFVLLFIFA